MHQLDVQARRLLAAERFDRLRGDAQPAGSAASQLRRGLGHLLVAAGRRLAPEAPPRATFPGDGAHRVTTLKG
jgi:hypothetical protein